LAKIFPVIVALVVFMAAAALPAGAQPGSGLKVDYLGSRSYPMLTRLVFGTGDTSPEKFRIRYDEVGRRIILVPSEGTISFSFEPVQDVDDNVLEVDYIQVEMGKLGVIVRLGKPARGFRVSYLGAPDRLVLDVYRQKGFKPFLPYHRDVKKIAIDPGHGGINLGVAGGDGLNEADITYGLAQRLSGILAKAGYGVVLTRDETEDPPPKERAGTANSHKADLFISLHVSTGNEAVRLITPDEGILGKRGPMAGGMLWGDQDAPYLPDSLKLARSLAGALTVGEAKEPPVSHARLRGFDGLTMPAVMVELGGFGATGGGSVHASDAYMDSLAGKLADGIISHAGGE